VASGTWEAHPVRSGAYLRDLCVPLAPLAPL